MRTKGHLPTAPKTLAVLRALHKGQKLTVLDALKQIKVYALSQECGRLRSLGWPVKARMVKVPSGARVAEYSL